MQKSYEREIINKFPYPIASRFIRLRTRQCKKPGFPRLDRILNTAEIITRYLAIIVINECREQLETHSELQGTLPKGYISPLKRPSWGHWISFIREGLRWLQPLGIELTMPEIHDFWFNHKLKPTPAAIALDSLVNMRNKSIGHNFQGLQEDEYDYLCTETWDKLTLVLESLDFLLGYKLRFIHRVEVTNIRRKDTVFIHEYSSAIGCMDDFEADDEHLSKLMETEATLLLNSNTRKYLNLEPLLVYENTAGSAPDIFFFCDMDSPQKAHYEACKHGGSFDLNKNEEKASKNSKERKARMVDELIHLMRLFSGEEVTA